MLLTIIIIVAAILAILLGIFVFARLFNQNKEKAQTVVSKSGLTAEQSQELKAAHTQLVNIRMNASRLKDSEINRVCVGACDAIERVLTTLKDKPEKIQTSKQLFNYYLPTLEKVIAKYQRIEAGGAANAEMPDKIKGYLADVSAAMGNMYEGMFDNDKLHVEVDMEAMTMAIKRDGLLDEEEFKSVAR